MKKHKWDEGRKEGKKNGRKEIKKGGREGKRREGEIMVTDDLHTRNIM